MDTTTSPDVWTSGSDAAQVVCRISDRPKMEYLTRERAKEAIQAKMKPVSRPVRSTILEAAPHLAWQAPSVC